MQDEQTQGIQIEHDLEKFSFIKGNRPIDEAHVRTIERSIARKNMLHLSPILVTQEFEVIDGQHRLQACKNMEIPIYYIVGGTADIEDLSILNSGQKNWAFEDHINLRASKGTPGYQRLLDMAKGADLKASSIVPLLWHRYGFTTSKRLKAGLISLESEDLDQVQAFITQYKAGMEWLYREGICGVSCYKKRVWILAFYWIYRTPFLDIDTIIKKLILIGRPLPMVANVADAVEVLVAAYNQKRTRNRAIVKKNGPSVDKILNVDVDLV